MRRPVAKPHLLDREVLTIGEVCAIFPMGPTTVYKLIKNGSLPAHKRGRITLIHRKDVDRYYENLPRIVPQEKRRGKEGSAPEVPN